jgi:hypothetical protein
VVGVLCAARQTCSFLAFNGRRISEFPAGVFGEVKLKTKEMDLIKVMTAERSGSKETHSESARKVQNL